MKYSPLILAAGAVGLVFANPHVHRTNDNCKRKKNFLSFGIPKYNLPPLYSLVSCGQKGCV